MNVVVKFKKSFCCDDEQLRKQVLKSQRIGNREREAGEQGKDNEREDSANNEKNQKYFNLFIKQVISK